MSVSTLLSTVTAHVREYVVPLYSSPDLPVVMVGGGTTWVTERKEGVEKQREERVGQKRAGEGSNQGEDGER